MPKDTKKVPVWFVDNWCTICDSKFKCGTTSALKNHENTERHQRLITKNSLNACSTNDEKHSQNSQKGISTLLLKSAAENILSFYLRLMIYGNLDGATNVNTRSRCIVAINNVIAPYYRELLRTEVGSKPFSLIFDEINETEVTGKLGIVIRYYSECNCELTTVFLKIVTLPSISARGIMDALQEIEQEFKLDLKNLVGIGTHNNANMIRINRYVFNDLKTKYNLSFFFPILCTSNSLLKAFSNASKTGIPNKFEFLIRESYEWFVDLKRIKYHSLYDTINAKQVLTDKSKINAISWLSMESAIANIIDNWEELKNHFRDIPVPERCLATVSLFSYYSDDCNKIFLLFIKDILSDIVNVNKAFQSSSPDFIKLFKELRDLRNKIHAKATNLFEWSIPVHNAIRQYKAEGGGEKDIGLIHDRITKFINNFNSELQLIGFAGLAQIENRLRIFDFSRNYSDPEIGNCIRQLVENLNINESVISKIENQVKRLRSPEVMNKMNQNFEQPWKFIFREKNAAGENPYVDVCHLLTTYLSLPFSNADVYQIFREMNEIEMEMLSREKLDIFNNLLMIKSIVKSLEKKNFLFEELPQNVRDDVRHIFWYTIDNSVAKYMLNRQDDDILVRLNKIGSIEN